MATGPDDTLSRRSEDEPGAGPTPAVATAAKGPVARVKPRRKPRIGFVMGEPEMLVATPGPDVDGSVVLFTDSSCESDERGYNAPDWD